jgi:2-polyprenyl-3-methyl-5-hydroxy-6-metoxy-1,4-benzoquinol methylase
LQEFLKNHEIKTVVDLGCGDWAFSRYIDWTGIEYIGIDVVKHVVERNQKLFAQDNIKFIHANFKAINIQEADLFLCKDALQHFSNDDIRKVIAHLPKYKHSLIANYIDLFATWKNNREIKTGQYHPIDLSLTPFKHPGEKVLLFFSGVAYKQTFYIKNSD